MSRDQVSGRKYSAILSMMVWRMEARSSDDVRALATSWNMVSSWLWRVNWVPAASDMLEIRTPLGLVALENYSHHLCARAKNVGNRESVTPMRNRLRRTG